MMKRPRLAPGRIRVPCILLVGVFLAISGVPAARLLAQDSIPGQAPPATEDTNGAFDTTAGQVAGVQDTALAQALLLEQQAQALADTIEALWLELDTLLRRYTRAAGEERLILDGQVERRVAVLRPSLGELTMLVVQVDSAGLDASRPRSVAITMLDNARRHVRDEVRAIGNRMVEGRAQRASTSATALPALERELTQTGTEYDEHLRALLNIADYKSALGVDVQEDLDYADPMILTRSDRLTSEIEVTARVVASLNDRLRNTEDEADAAEFRLELTAAQERLHASTAGLAMLIELMDRRGMATADSKRLLIQTTGRVTTDVFDVDVATGLVRQAWDSGRAWFSEHAPQFLFNLLIFAIIIVVFRILSQITRRLATRALDRTTAKVPALLRQLGVSMMANAVLLLGILIGLSQMGVHVGPVLAGLGVAGFIVGFALQDSLSNFASGMMILIYRPFDVGDVIEAGGVTGKVDHLSLVSTTIVTFDNQRLIVPNRQVWGNVIRNKTAEPIRRVDLTFEVGRRSDVPRAETLFREILEAHPSVLDDPAPAIVVDELGESSVRFQVRPWVDTPDYWAVYWGVTRIVNDRLEAEGIAPPLPKREVITTGATAAGGTT